MVATLDAEKAYSEAEFVVIAAPTNYDSATQHFDTSAVENVIGLFYNLWKVFFDSRKSFK